MKTYLIKKVRTANNVYKLRIVLAYSENPAEFPMASTCLQLSVTNHATAHTPNVSNKPKTKNEQLIKHSSPNFSLCVM